MMYPMLSSSQILDFARHALRPGQSLEVPPERVIHAEVRNVPVRLPALHLYLYYSTSDERIE